MSIYIAGENIAYLLAALFAVAYLLSRNRAVRDAIGRHGTLFDLFVIGASIVVVLAMIYLPAVLGFFFPTSGGV
jgi:hypothetical protein